MRKRRKHNTELLKKLKEKLFNLKIGIALKKALERGEVEIYYQPQYSMDKNLQGFEALLRWKNKKFSHIPVGDIIKKIEDFNLIYSIGEYVIEKAFIFAKTINEGLRTPLIVSINISPLQLMTDNFVERIKYFMEKLGVNPEWIGLEITENIGLKNIEKNIEKLKELKSLGTRILLDDFGTGYSCLNWLMELPLSAIKIARCFIKEIVQQLRYRTMVKFIIDTAKALKLPVIAEGIETEEEFSILKEMQVEYVQGFLFSKAVPEQEAIKFIGK